MDNPEPSTPLSENSQLDPEGNVHISPPLDFSGKAILALAVPALGSLVIEPTLILIDSVMVGHLGTVSLAGLSLASTVLNTLVGVFVFLAYSTTAVTARLFGAGRRADGLRAGIEAIWLAFGLAVALVAVLEVAAPLLVGLLGAEGDVSTAATAYLRAGAPGMIGMLVILAATGTLRGLLDTRTPLYVLAGGAVVNVLSNVLFIYGLGWEIVGAGVGLSLTQTLMGAVMVYLVMRAGRRAGISLVPSSTGVLSSVGHGIPLFVRTISLRVALLVTVMIATQAGTLALAAHQVVNSIWTISAFALDALAIAAQGMVGVALGAGSLGLLRSLIRRLSWWGVGAAAVLGALIAATSPWLPLIFGPDPQMHAIATKTLFVAGVMLPLGGLAWILDGVLIGASQGPYLAKTGVVTLVLYLPTLWLLHRWIQDQAPLDAAAQGTAMVWLWVSFAGWFMLLRAATNSWRAYSSTKLVGPAA